MLNKKKKCNLHKLSLNTLTSLTEKLSRRNTPDLMNNNSNSNKIRARAASLTVLTMRQQ